MLLILPMFIVIIILLPIAQIHIFAFMLLPEYSYSLTGPSNWLLCWPEQDHLWRGCLGKFLLYPFITTWCLHDIILDRYPPNIKWSLKHYSVSIYDKFNCTIIRIFLIKLDSISTLYQVISSHCPHYIIRWRLTICGSPTFSPSASSSPALPGFYQMFWTFKHFWDNLHFCVVDAFFHLNGKADVFCMLMIRRRKYLESDIRSFLLYAYDAL